MEVCPHGVNSPPALDRAAAERRSEFGSATTPNPSSEANPASAHCSKPSLADPPHAPSTEITQAGAALDRAPSHAEEETRNDQDPVPTPPLHTEAKHALDQPQRRKLAIPRTAQSTAATPAGAATARAAKPAEREHSSEPAPAQTPHHSSEERPAPEPQGDPETAKSRSAQSTEDGPISEASANAANPAEPGPRPRPEPAPTLNHSLEEKRALDPPPAPELARTRNAQSTEAGPHTPATARAANPADPELRAEAAPAPAPNHSSEEQRALDLPQALAPATPKNVQSTADGPGTEATVHAAKSADPEPRPGADHATTLPHNSEEQAALDLPPAPPLATPTVALQSPMSRLM